MSLKTYIVKYYDHQGAQHTGTSDAFDVRHAMSSFFELNPEALRIVSCVQKPEW